MAINKESVISVFDEKMTLLQYLKTIEKALVSGIVTNFECVQVDETHIKFKLVFADNTTYESAPVEIPQPKMYFHCINFENPYLFCVNIFSLNKTPFTFETFKKFFLGLRRPLNANGDFKSHNGRVCIINKLSNDGTDFVAYGFTISGGALSSFYSAALQENNFVMDVVIEL